ncbi:MAG: HD-GYP domain-containing protein, partial [Lachnospiraceae bacterium]|nr:HD-GYP domain-containing protein [Lachnospiraceae bacterium]
MKDIAAKHTKAPTSVFVIMIVLYFAAIFTVAWVSRSDRTMMVGGKILPFSAFAGVLSSIANILIIFLTVFYDRLGFIASLAILIMQIPVYARNVSMQPNLASLPGIFGTLITIIAIIIIYRRKKKISAYQQIEVENLTQQQRLSQHLFEQTATALVNAVDAKDTYSRGHSLRVAGYSENIARMLGKSSEECYRIYYTALLHDVGKIGIEDGIINKKGKLTPDEYEIMKKHPIYGNQILSSISEYPYLSIGAHYHHERYDGKGYPDGLKGEDIPEIARIISVADAYDAMTSERSYRDALPQQLVREEIVKGAGTQFDPVIAGIMKKIIDTDAEYSLREKNVVKELAGYNELYCEEYKSNVSDGIQVTEKITKIHLKCGPLDEKSATEMMPAIILFDSLDGRLHRREKTVRDLNYYEYCEIFFDGRTNDTGVRKIKTETTGSERGDRAGSGKTLTGRKDTVYDIEASKYNDHVLITIDDGEKTLWVTIALPDSSRYVYIGLTGRYCHLSDVGILQTEKEITADHIQRIAEEISYIDGPEGDIPNIQINGQRSDTTIGVPVNERLKLSFHTKSLPTSRLIWHCPHIVLFS